MFNHGKINMNFILDLDSSSWGRFGLNLNPYKQMKKESATLSETVQWGHDYYLFSSV